MANHVGDHQLTKADFGLTHNRGGRSANSAAAVSLHGRLIEKERKTAGLFFEQFERGQIFTHEIRRTVTDLDTILFSSLTYNPAAIHIDHEYAKGTEFDKPLMNSCALRNQRLPTLPVTA
jgi:MaoC like domain